MNEYIKNNLFRQYAVLYFSIFIIGCNGGEEASNAPNILILYADDLGWSDIGCYGSSKNETPNIDKLAAEGVKFSNAYAPSPICSASRASLMTGKSPARLHFEFVSTEKIDTGYPLLPPKRTLDLPLDEVTIGEIAKNAGYNTAFFGKWHIAKHNKGYLKWSDTHGPFQQGFNEGSDHFGSHPYDVNNREMLNLENGLFPRDSLVIQAIDFLQRQKNSKQPFLMFFSSYFVHTPVFPNNSWLIEKYRNKLTGAPENEILYAAFVETMDHYFGKILEALRKYGFEENTIVLFTSDNGGHPGYTTNEPLRGNKWNLYEGGIRVPFIIKWPGIVNRETENSLSVIQWDVMPTVSDIFQQEKPENIDGESLLPLLKGKAETLSRKSIYWHFPYYHPAYSYEGTKPCSAIREGNYKLIYFYEDQRVELYNLDNDIIEANNLASQVPDMTNRLKEKLFKQLNEVNARFAITNPSFGLDK